jgi:hypothetical protein
MSGIEEERTTPGADTPGSSLMDRLRAKHQELSERQTIDIPLPGYEDLLVARYRVLTVKNEISPIAKRVAKESKGDQGVAQLSATLDAMARACVELLTPRDDELVPLSGAFGPDEPPVRYDERLAEFMGWTDVTNARETILKLFAGNEPMVLAHGNMLQRWMSDTSRDVSNEFLSDL